MEYKLQRPDDPSGKTFEHMCNDIMNRVYQSQGRTFQLYGRVGQDQNGIDNFAIFDDECVFIQCKDFTYDKNYHLVKERKKVYDQFQSQIEKAIPRAWMLFQEVTKGELTGNVDADERAFLENCMKNKKVEKITFIAMTTLDPDVEVQKLLMKYQSRYSMGIEIWFWDQISDHIQAYPELFSKYYPMIEPAAKSEEELELQEFYYHWKEAKKLQWADDVEKEESVDWERKRAHIEPLYELVNHRLSDMELRVFSQKLSVVEENLLPYIDENNHLKGRFQRLSGYACRFAEYNFGRHRFVASPYFVSRIDFWMAQLECEHPIVEKLKPGRYVHIDHAKVCMGRAKKNIQILKSITAREYWDEMECLEEEIAILEKKIALLEVGKGEVVIRVNEPTDPKLFFEPVFSSAFDSVRSGKPGNRDLVEISLMQHAAAGKTILLQGPQVVDNIDILSLLAEEKISPLIEKGIITFSAYGNIYTPYDYFKTNIKKPQFDSVTFPFLVGDDDITVRRRAAVLVALEWPSATTKKQMMQTLADLKEEEKESVEKLYQAMMVLKRTLNSTETMKYYQSDSGKRMKTFTLANSYQSMMERGIKVSSLIGYRLTELEKEEELCQFGRADLFRRLRNVDAYMKGKRCEYRSDYYKVLQFLKENEEARVCLGTGGVTVENLEDYRGLVDRAYNVFQGYLSSNHLYLTATANELSLWGDYDEVNDDQYLVDYCLRNYPKDPSGRRTTLDFENIMEIAYDSREMQAEKRKTPEELATMMSFHLGVDTYVTKNGCIEVTKANYKLSEGQTMGLSNEKSEGTEAFSNENIVNEGIR